MDVGAFNHESDIQDIETQESPATTDLTGSIMSPIFRTQESQLSLEETIEDGLEPEQVRANQFALTSFVRLTFCEVFEALHHGSNAIKKVPEGKNVLLRLLCV